MSEDHEIITLSRSSITREKAFTLLVKKYQQKLYWHIRRMVLFHEDTNDVIQNTFIRIWQNMDKFREESKLYTWLYRIATNEALSYIRQKHKRNSSSVDEENDTINKLKADRYFDGDELQVRLQEAIQTLPEKQMIVFNLRYYEEMKYEDMAEILETSEGALKASYHHAVKKIEKYINGL